MWLLGESLAPRAVEAQENRLPLTSVPSTAPLPITYAGPFRDDALSTDRAPRTTGSAQRGSLTPSRLSRSCSSPRVLVDRPAGATACRAMALQMPGDDPSRLRRSHITAAGGRWSTRQDSRSTHRSLAAPPWRPLLGPLRRGSGYFVWEDRLGSTM